MVQTSIFKYLVLWIKYVKLNQNRQYNLIKQSLIIGIIEKKKNQSNQNETYVIMDVEFCLTINLIKTIKAIKQSKQSKEQFD